jgi:hypothetical protein
MKLKSGKSLLGMAWCSGGRKAECRICSPVQVNTRPTCFGPLYFAAINAGANRWWWQHKSLFNGNRASSQSGGENEGRTNSPAGPMLPHFFEALRQNTKVLWAQAFVFPPFVAHTLATNPPLPFPYPVTLPARGAQSSPNCAYSLLTRLSGALIISGYFSVIHSS